MNLYLITLYNRYDAELCRIEQHATSMALALLVSEARLRGLEGAVSAQVDLIVDEPGFGCLVDESAGQRELAETPPAGQSDALHSVRADLREPLPERLGGGYVEPVDMEAVARLEDFSRGLGEIDGLED